MDFNYKCVCVKIKKIYKKFDKIIKNAFLKKRYQKYFFVKIITKT